MANPTPVPTRDHTVLFDLTLQSRGPVEAARTAFFALRERLAVNADALSFRREIGADSNLNHRPVDSLSVGVQRGPESTLVFGFEHPNQAVAPSPGCQRYHVRVPLWITADDPMQAVTHALDDLRDGDMACWELDVTSLPRTNTPPTRVVFEQGLDY